MQIRAHVRIDALAPVSSGHGVKHCLIVFSTSSVLHNDLCESFVARLYLLQRYHLISCLGKYPLNFRSNVSKYRVEWNK